MTIKKGDLVKLKYPSNNHNEKSRIMNWEFGLVLKGPYEEQIVITASPFPVTVVELVCDVISGEHVFKAIPVDHLVRHQQKLPDASP